MDFLGLRTLTVIRDTLNIIKHTKGEEIDLQKIPLNSPEVYKMLAGAKQAEYFSLKAVGCKVF